ncbi:MAG: hypothetical protein U5N10_04105 [Gemmobacter sp.]|nr:hypothetical protein [Gemmobacter sp.]
MTVDIYNPTANDGLSLEEFKLYKLVSQYRAQFGLDPIPLSQALTITAGRHAMDTVHNILIPNLDQPEGANLHSWSDAPYFGDHRDPAVMWEAPARIGTGFTGFGYEISVYIGGRGSVEQALKLWQGSPGHDAVMTNSDIWSQLKFNAMGVGIERAGGETIMHIWFSDSADIAPPKLLGTRKADTLQGTGFADHLSGQGGRDKLLGGAGADMLDGGAGADVLTGGAGPDTFFFAHTGGDRITDFRLAQGDRIALEGDVFTALGGSVEAAEFRRGAARDADDHLIYFAATGKLFYDADGNGAGARQLIATLDGRPALAFDDIVIL